MIAIGYALIGMAIVFIWLIIWLNYYADDHKEPSFGQCKGNKALLEKTLKEFDIEDEKNRKQNKINREFGKNVKLQREKMDDETKPFNITDEDLIEPENDVKESDFEEFLRKNGVNPKNNKNFMDKFKKAKELFDKNMKNKNK